MFIKSKLNHKRANYEASWRRQANLQNNPSGATVPLAVPAGWMFLRREKRGLLQVPTSLRTMPPFYVKHRV